MRRTRDVQSSPLAIIDAKHLRIRGKKHTLFLATDAKGKCLGSILLPGGETKAGYSLLLRQIQGLQAVVSDGGTGITSLIREKGLAHQRCHVHLLRDLRNGLRISRLKRKRPIGKTMIAKAARLLLRARDEKTKAHRLAHLERIAWIMYDGWGLTERETIRGFIRKFPLAFAFLRHPELTIPTTTNHVENLIGRIEARLKTMRGLKSLRSAELYIDALLDDG